jgi:hypothetical protein
VQNQVLFLSQDSEVHRSFRTGISLHGHTKHSLESLGFLGKFVREHALLRAFIADQAKKVWHRSRIRIDFDQAYWTPPLSALQAHELETHQIESLGLSSIVSLSDHDNIEAATLLRESAQYSDVPVSVEWTVPFGRAVFHLGIHNMPPNTAQDLMSALRVATEEANEQRIIELLFEVRRIPSVLVVFNHPVWNFTGIAPDVFDYELRRFLQCAGEYFDAFELNGMRDWEENRKVIKLAAEWNHILISGGDRHACEPNAILNVTNAADFPEFIDEVQNGRQSVILVMPQYQHPIHWRFYQSFAQVIRWYPEFPEGQRKWDQRILHPSAAGDLAPLSQLWPRGTPGFLAKIFALAGFIARIPPYGSMRAERSLRMTESLKLSQEPMNVSMDCLR